MCEDLVPFLLTCEVLVPFLFMCEDLVPFLLICEDLQGSSDVRGFDTVSSNV